MGATGLEPVTPSLSSEDNEEDEATQPPMSTGIAASRRDPRPRPIRGDPVGFGHYVVFVPGDPETKVRTESDRTSRVGLRPLVPDRLSRRWVERRRRRELAKAILKRDWWGTPRLQDTVPSEGERLTVHLVAAIEMYTPRHAKALYENLGRLGFSDSWHRNGATASDLARRQRESLSGSWSNLGLIATERLPRGTTAGFTVDHLPWNLGAHDRSRGRRPTKPQSRCGDAADGFQDACHDPQWPAQLRHAGQSQARRSSCRTKESTGAGRPSCPRPMSSRRRSAGRSMRTVAGFLISMNCATSRPILVNDSAWRLSEQWEHGALTFAARRRDVSEQDSRHDWNEPWTTEDRSISLKRVQDSHGESLVLWASLQLVRAARRQP